jgi:hypothetical protein
MAPCAAILQYRGVPTNYTQIQDSALYSSSAAKNK